MGDTLSLRRRSGKREKSKAANRQAILDAGRTVFARMGFEACTVRDIIRQTDLAAGTFYNYFKSKEEVFEAIAEESTRRFRDVLAEVRSEATSFHDYVRAAYRAYFQFLSQENEAAIQAGEPHMALIGVRVDTPEMKAVFEEVRLDLERTIADNDLQRIDTEYLTAAAVGIAREMGDRMLERRPVDIDEVTDFACNFLIAGVSTLLENTKK